MSIGSTDFFLGQQSSNLAHRAAINEWEGLANRLEDKLQSVQMSFAKAEAGRIGFAQLFRMMADELRRLDPQNPLLNKETQLQLLNDVISQKADAMGYVYDPHTDSLRKRR